MDKLAKGKARAPGTCGELVEGTIDGKNFLISCPIDLWSEITFKNSSEESEEDNCFKADMFLSKTRQAISTALPLLSIENTKFSISRESTIPEGKGMGSSTADISAGLAAAARAYNKDISSCFIADIALGVEPSDATMYPGIYLFDHKNGLLRHYLNAPLPADIVVLDPGGQIDTMKFNSSKSLAELNAKKEPLVRKAYKLVVEGLHEKDLEKVGRGATISAEANQELLLKPELENIIIWAQEIKSFGVIAAHSGTVIGVLLSPGISRDKDEVVEFFKKKLKNFNVLSTKMIGGGVV